MNTYWNHRVMRKLIKDSSGKDVGFEYGIYEVYYTDGEVTSWTKDRIEPYADEYDSGLTPSEAIEALRQDLNWMLAALDKPVLNHEDGKEITS